MYCVMCGTEKREGATYCSNCGYKFDSMSNNISNNNVESQTKENGVAAIVLGILGIIGSILVVFSPIAFVLSLLGLIISIVERKKKKNTAGLVLNSIGLFLSIIVIATIIFLVNLFVNSVVNATGDNGEKMYDVYKEYAEKF